ncbi:MAG: cation:proton antiporter [Verrucomicrobiaceae bacterium]|nr:cation:proton antiporter [Verrucomicrobiaceae bacterium]
MTDLSLITTIAGCATAALVGGLAAKRFGLSPLVGYLLAGIAVGPHTPGFVGDEHIASQLAEIGVMLMMFAVGLHFHLADLMRVKGIAITGAVGQSLVATAACIWLTTALGWPLSQAMVLGVAVSVASTVVLLRSLDDHGLVETPEGHAAVGWLVVEDILTIIILVLLPPLAADDGGGQVWLTLGMALGKLAIFMVVMLVAGARLVPWLLHRVAKLRSRELFTLTVLVLAVAVATLAYFVFGASMALGAFLAGMVVGQSKLSHQAAADLLPMKDAFAVLFFVSVGMLFDYRVLLAQPLLVAGVTAIIVMVKPLAALLIVLIRGHALRTAFTVAGGLAQIGEFSFIVGGLGVQIGMLPRVALDVLVAGAMISICINPLLFRWMLAAEPRLDRWSWLKRRLSRAVADRGEKLNLSQDTSRNDAIVVGYGPVGRTVTRLLREGGLTPVVIETNIDTVSQIQSEGHHAIYGDAASHEILAAAGLARARYLVITVPKAAISTAIMHSAREMNATTHILCRAAYLNEHDQLKEAGATIIRFDEGECATALAKAVLHEMKLPDDQIAQNIRNVRDDLGIRADIL